MTTAKTIRIGGKATIRLIISCMTFIATLTANLIALTRNLSTALAALRVLLAFLAVLTAFFISLADYSRPSVILWSCAIANLLSVFKTGTRITRSLLILNH